MFFYFGNSLLIRKIWPHISFYTKTQNKIEIYLIIYFEKGVGNPIVCYSWKTWRNIPQSIQVSSAFIWWFNWIKFLFFRLIGSSPYTILTINCFLIIISPPPDFSISETFPLVLKSGREGGGSYDFITKYTPLIQE